MLNETCAWGGVIRLEFGWCMAQTAYHNRNLSVLNFRGKRAEHGNTTKEVSEQRETVSNTCNTNKHFFFLYVPRTNTYISFASPRCRYSGATMKAGRVVCSRERVPVAKPRSRFCFNGNGVVLPRGSYCEMPADFVYCLVHGNARCSMQFHIRHVYSSSTCN